MRKAIAAGNWKMNLLTTEADELFGAIKEKVKGHKSLPEIILAPPSVYLQRFASHAISEVKLAAQNCWFEMKGAYTGEISPQMIADLKISYCLVGHSERREIFGEDDELLAKKTSALLSVGVKPIYCCGEKLEERQAAKHFKVVEQQISKGLFQIEAKDWENIILAYEPVWAIGTGETASSEQAQEMHNHIRQYIADHVGREIADSLRVLYGGSVKPNNAGDLFSCPDVDGALVGGASLNADDFQKIIMAF